MRTDIIFDILNILKDYDGWEIFNCEEILPDYMEVIYNNNGIRVIKSTKYNYLQIGGLTDEEMKKVKGEM